MAHRTFSIFCFSFFAIALLTACGGEQEKSVKQSKLTHAQPDSASNEHKFQTELRISLNSTGFAQLKKHLPKPDTATRDDFYFDQFDSGSFVLKYKPQAVKVRLMQSPNQVDAQISRKISEQQVDTDSYVVTLTKSEAWQRKLEFTEYSQIMKSSELFFGNLKKGGESLRSLAQGASRDWNAMNWPGLELLQANCEGTNWTIYPAARNTKNRIKSVVVAHGIEFRVQIGDTLAWDENGTQVHLYEVEAEPRNAEKVSDEDLADSFVEVLEKMAWTQTEWVQNPLMHLPILLLSSIRN